MTKTLILMRHCKSDWGDRSLDDADRPLNDRGHRAAAALGPWLAGISVRPEVALVSAALRTRQTWDGVSDSLPETEAHVLSDLYLASERRLQAAIARREEDSVLVIAHNPGIAHLAHSLAYEPPDHDRFIDYPTGATTILDFDIDVWTDMKKGTVRDFTVPRDLMKA